MSGVVPGFVIDRIMSVRDALQPLELAYFFDSLESEGRIVFRQRANARTDRAFTQSDLVEHRPAATLSTIKRAQETDLPASAKISYVSAAGAYPQAIAEARRISGGSQRVSSAALPLVLDSVVAGAIVDTWLFESWAARERATFTLPPSQLALEPGDTVMLSAGTRSYRLRITEIGEHGARDIQALSFDQDVYRPVPVTDRGAQLSVELPSGPPRVVLLDVPPLTDDASDIAGYAAATKKPWPGTIAVWRSPETSGYQLKSLLPTPATTGLTVNSLGAGPSWRFDHANKLLVDLDAGTLASSTRLQVLGGANVAALEQTPDVWEVFQFESATLVAPGRYELQTLLRGQRGTDRADFPVIHPGSRFVLLDASVTAVDMSADDIGILYNWRVGPAARDIGDASYIGLSHTFKGTGLLPLRPVQLRGHRNAVGDLTISWLRRTRRHGDSWEPTDVPLGEEIESYFVEILASSAANANKVRSLTVPASLLVYPASQQITDFGDPQSRIVVRIAQISRSAGLGAATTVAL